MRLSIRHQAGLSADIHRAIDDEGVAFVDEVDSGRRGQAVSKIT